MSARLGAVDRGAEAADEDGTGGRRSLGAAAAALWIAFGAATFPTWTADDAFVTFRYARNLAFAGQLAWNVGEPPVEGVTGLLWPVALAALFRLGARPEVAARTLGVIALALGALALHVLLRRSRLRSGAAALALVVALPPVLFTHATGGLETTAFYAALAASMCALERAIATSAARARPLAGALLVACLLRPEGVVFAAAALVALAVGVRSDRAACVRAAWTLGAGFLAPALAVLALRVGYFGHLLPNTFYAKPVIGFHREALAPLLGLGRYLVPPLAVAVVATLARVGHLGASKLPRSFLLTAAAGVVAAAIVCTEYARTALSEGYSFRFHAPLLALIAPALGAWFDLSLDALHRHVRALVLAGVFAVEGAAFARSLVAQRTFAADYARCLEDEHGRAASLITRLVPPGETLAVYVDAGLVPYRTGLRAVDFGGLSDEHLARDHLDDRAFVDAFFGANAGALLFTSHEATRLRENDDPRAEAIAADPRFERYVLVSAFATEAPLCVAYFQRVYVRRDLAR